MLRNFWRAIRTIFFTSIYFNDHFCVNNLITKFNRFRILKLYTMDNLFRATCKQCITLFLRKKEKSLEKNVRLFCFVNTNILARSLNLHPLKNKLKRRGTWCFWSVFSQLEPIDREWRHQLLLPRCSVNWLHPTWMCVSYKRELNLCT